MSKTNITWYMELLTPEKKMNVFSVLWDFTGVLGFLIYLQKIWSWDSEERQGCFQMFYTDYSVLENYKLYVGLFESQMKRFKIRLKMQNKILIWSAGVFCFCF